MKIFALIFYIFPLASFASNENVDHVFYKGISGCSGFIIMYRCS